MIIKSIRYHASKFSESGLFQFPLITGCRCVIGRIELRMSTDVEFIYISLSYLLMNNHIASIQG